MAEKHPYLLAFQMFAWLAATGGLLYLAADLYNSGYVNAGGSVGIAFAFPLFSIIKLALFERFPDAFTACWCYKDEYRHYRDRYFQRYNIGEVQIRERAGPHRRRTTRAPNVVLTEVPVYAEENYATAGPPYFSQYA